MRNLTPLASFLLLACGGGGPTAPACDLTVDTMAGNTFVMSEAQPNGPDQLNPLARLKFVDEGGKVKAKYTAMSLGDIYTYECEKQQQEGKDPELKCVEPARLKDWCEALFAHDIKCTKKKLQKLGTDASDADLDKAIEEAKAAMKAAEQAGEAAFAQWKAIRGSLGNKLQGQLFAKVDSRCRLKVDDMYWTLKKDGEKVQDTNPVGTNPFVKTDTPYMFEHCSNQSDMFDGDKEGFPTLPIQEAPMNELGKPIHYYMIGEAGSKPEEGCTYSYDTFAGWVPLAKDQAAAPNADGRIEWHATHTFDEKTARKVQDVTMGIFHMARYKTCGGKKDLIDVACRATRL